MTEQTEHTSSLSLITAYVTAMQARDTAAMEQLRASDFLLDWVHNDAFVSSPINQKAISQFWSTWFEAFQEMDFEATRTIVGENVAVIQWIFTGTQTGILGIPVFDPPLEPTGKTIRIRGISVYDLEAGLIRRETMYIDLATLWVELGVNP